MKALLLSLFVVGLFVAACPSNPDNSTNQKIKWKTSSRSNIKEPSDLALSADGQSFFIVSDDGILYEADLKGTIKRKAAFEATDFEACYATSEKVMVVDERTRLVHTYSLPNLERTSSIEVPYFGGRNKGFESLTYNGAKGRYIMITEKDPTIVFELNEQLQVLDRVTIDLGSDISAATFHNGKLYFLSDEAHTIYEADPRTYQVIKQWELNIVNPEGIAFLPDGQVAVVSDDAGTIYFFEPLN